MGKRRFRILDTNVLINYWRRWRLWQRKESEVTEHARRLIEVYNTHLIASPVRIEFLCGAEGGENLRLCLAYLAPFELVDGGQIPRQDWLEAERFAKRVVRHGRGRKLGDCLLQAISLRLNCEVITADSDFQRRARP
jgi:predicted nucleic acid-binding protein